MKLRLGSDMNRTTLVLVIATEPASTCQLPPIVYQLWTLANNNTFSLTYYGGIYRHLLTPSFSVLSYTIFELETIIKTKANADTFFDFGGQTSPVPPHKQTLAAADETLRLPSPEATHSEHMAPPSKLHRAGILVMPASVSLLNTFNSGLLTVAPPAIARELDIAPSVQQWPASVYALGFSCGLLPLGAIADVVGNRPVFLTGLLLYTVFTLAVSLSRTGGELIAFRTAYPRVAPAMLLLRSLVAVIQLASPWGPVLGGVFVQAASWRAGYWMSTSVNAVFMILAFFCLPKLTNGVASFVRRPHSIALSIVAGLLVPFYVFWESRQERLGRPAVLPNSIWHRLEFATACLSVLLTWSWFNAFSYWATLYYQESQQLDALQTAPNSWTESTRKSAFPAMIMSVISTDLLFNISNLIITNNFPSKSQALAGGVFNTVAQSGNSIGLAVTAMIAASVITGSCWKRKNGYERLRDIQFFSAAGLLEQILDMLRCCCCGHTDQFDWLAKSWEEPNSISKILKEFKFRLGFGLLG
ncbi:uncharacterized protein CLUP02_18032 [Colletotrichum lupini]|uniref:Major facilitator superfamily transporter n=1 Tax=Colletotrichum lupini TaxID=145971 RepID=A0A9Q8SFQ0_9PEZI|nr:uncharacterized protein CLUP02_18032 [Colletotrichum lupini]UQC76519.1 hypothetical protein CLUP02_18032 [Colletotrichum lupini]